jgi:hypothetical protein
MELRPKRKMLFFTMVACILLSVVLIESLAADGHDHDCKGEGCPVCMQIETAQNFLKALKIAVLASFLAVFLAFTAQTYLKPADSTTNPFSPITLKVRFNS